MNHTGNIPKTNPQSSVVAVVPARFASTRLPGKALLNIAGKPMIVWVVERALAATTIDRVIVATDDQRVLDSVKSFGHEALMTRGDHLSGTDRIAEVVRNISDAEIVVNVQGDEPLISPETIDAAVRALVDDPTADITTTWEPIERVEDVVNPDVVKVVVDKNQRALYFSRQPIPYIREAVRKHGSVAAGLKAETGLVKHFKKHTGLYVYRRDALLRFTSLPQATGEQLEGLEQLRALEHGMTIKAIAAQSLSIGVDTPDDLERVRTIVEREKTQVQVISSK